MSGRPPVPPPTGDGQGGVPAAAWLGTATAFVGCLGGNARPVTDLGVPHHRRDRTTGVVRYPARA